MNLLFPVVTLLISSFDPAVMPETNVYADNPAPSAIETECSSLRLDRYSNMKPPQEPSWYFFNDRPDSVGLRLTNKKNYGDKETITYLTAFSTPKGLEGMGGKVFTSPDTREQTSILGLLPLQTAHYSNDKPNGDFREYSYDISVRDIANKISSLKPGEDFSVAYTEYSKLDGRINTVDGTAHIKFLGCEEHPDFAGETLKRFSMQVESRSYSMMDKTDTTRVANVVRTFDDINYFPYTVSSEGSHSFLLRTSAKK
jgi:hypothetical protein